MAVADKSSTIADDVGDGGDVGDGDDVGDGGDVGDFCLVWLDMCVCRGTMAAPPLQSSLVPHLNSKMICSWFMLPLVLFGCFAYLFSLSVLFICFVYLFWSVVMVSWWWYLFLRMSACGNSRLLEEPGTAGWSFVF